MKTYVIYGGGQRCQQNAALYAAIQVNVCETNWDKKSGVCGSDSFTGPMWSNSLETLINWAEAWAGKPVKVSVIE